MLGIWHLLIDIIFPPPDCIRQLRSVSAAKILTRLEPHKVSHDSVALSRYDDTVMRAAITANKFHDSRRAASLLAQLLESYITKNYPETNIWLVPIPLSQDRQIKRGYNQVTRVIEQVKCPQGQVQCLLQRLRETAPQTSLRRAERLKNMHGAFGAVPKFPPLPPGTHVLIIDDVTTTGATLTAARAALAPHLPPGTPLTGLALAH